MKINVRLLGIMLLCVFAFSIVGCFLRRDQDEDEPEDVIAALISVNPADGSAIAANASITLTFDYPPTDVTANPGVAIVAGKNATIYGPFTTGALALTITWADGLGQQVLNYTVFFPDTDDGDEPKSEPDSPPEETDPPDPSLILSFSFDKLVGDRVIDHSQHGNDGTLVGNPKLVNGKFGKALEFNGESDWVEVPHDDSLTVDENVTVMAWIHTARHGGPKGSLWQGIIAKGNNPRSYSFYTEANGGLHLSVSDFRGVDRSDGKVKLNEWQHVVAQVDDGIHRYWINGISAGNFPVNAQLPGRADQAPVLVGNTHDNLPARASNRQFLGSIDEVRVWNRALSEAEILKQMKSSGF